jgi:putative endonuclease
LRRSVLYTGVTNDLLRRISEHRNETNKGFTSKYACHLLVWYEHHFDINDAIKKEKTIKGGSRKRKMDLISEMNPEWKDLYVVISGE